MAWGDPYVGVDEFKARVGSVGNATDAALLAVLAAASRQIENATGRYFNQTAAGTVRYATARYPDFLDVPDLVSVAELATDDGTRAYGTVWAAADYDLAPFDAGDNGRPYTEIRVAPTGTLAFWAYARGVRITGVWGWPAVPDQIKEACFLTANRLKSLWTAPFGVSGGPAGGQFGSVRMTASDLDPTIMALIAPYVVTGL